jgi:rod shape-determining protein MreD
VRVFPYLIYLLLLAAHVVVTRDLTAVYGVTINLAALMVLITALYKSELIAAWFGLAAGIVLAAATPVLLGWHALALVAIGVFGFHVKERLNLDNVYTRLLFVLGGVFTHNVLLLLINGGDALFLQLGTNALPSAVYTVVLAYLFFVFKDGVITYRKFRSIF